MVRCGGRDGRQERIPERIVDGMSVARTVRKTIHLRKIVDTQCQELAMNIILKFRRTVGCVPGIETDLILRRWDFGHPQSSNVGSRFSSESVKVIVEAESRRIGRNNSPPPGPTTCADVPIKIRFHIARFPVQRSAKKRIGNVADDSVGLSVLDGEKQRERSDGPVV